MRFAASCVLLFGGYVMSAVLWARIVDDMGGPRIPAPRAVRIFMIANLGRYVPGKVWQIAGLAVLARREGVAAGTATGAAVAGQGVALGAATLVGLAAVMASVGASGPGMAVGAGLLLVLMAVALVPPVFSRLAAVWFRLAREETPAGLSSADGARWLLFYTLNWVLYAVSFWVMVASLGLDVGVVTAGSAFAAAYVLGYVMIFAPAGVGVREGFLVALLTPHVGAAPSGAVAILARLWTTGVEVVPAAAFWLRHVAAGTAERNPEDGR